MEPVEAPGDVVEAPGEAGDVGVIVLLELPQRDEGEEEEGEEGEEAVGEALAPGGGELQAGQGQTTRSCVTDTNFI